MTEAYVVSAVRTPVGTSYKGTLRETTPEELAAVVVRAAVDRAGLRDSDVDDVILAEAQAGGGDIARHAAYAAGLHQVPGQAVNRHCAGGLTAIGNAAAVVRSGMEHAVVAGGTHSYSMNPTISSRLPGQDEPLVGARPTFPYYVDEVHGPATDDVSLAVGWNVAGEVGLTRAEMDAWALRSHERAVRAIEAGQFADEIVPVTVRLDGAEVLMTQDEHPRRGSTAEKLAALAPLHPEIDGFSITAGNASGLNDGAAAVAVVSERIVTELGLTPLARVRAWGAVGVPPHLTGLGAVEVISLVLKRASLDVADVDLWEINEAFASTPLAAVRMLGLDEELVNPWGSGCSLGHPIAATGARMVTSLVHELHRRGSGIAVAAMCAAGGQGGAMVVEAV